MPIDPNPSGSVERMTQYTYLPLPASPRSSLPPTERSDGRELALARARAGAGASLSLLRALPPCGFAFAFALVAMAYLAALRAAFLGAASCACRCVTSVAG